MIDERGEYQECPRLLKTLMNGRRSGIAFEQEPDPSEIYLITGECLIAIVREWQQAEAELDKTLQMLSDCSKQLHYY